MTTSLDLLKSLTRDEYCALSFFQPSLSAANTNNSPIVLNHDPVTNLNFAAYRNKYFYEIPHSDRSDLPKLINKLWEKSHLILSSVDQKLSFQLRWKARKARVRAHFLPSIQAKKLVDAYQHSYQS